MDSCCLYNLDGDKKRTVEDFIKDQYGGKLSIGSIYINKWYPDGTTYDGGSYVYYKGETLREWRNRNGGHLPKMEAPDEAVEMLDNEGWEGLEKFFDKIPGLDR